MRACIACKQCLIFFFIILSRSEVLERLGIDISADGHEMRYILDHLADDSSKTTGAKALSVDTFVRPGLGCI